MKVVVTGGAGFIGSHLVDALITENFEVHVIDDLSEGKREQVNARATLHIVDIRDLEAIRPVIEDAIFVFHEAAIPRVQLSINDPQGTHSINVDGTLNVLIAAKDGGVRRVVYAASAAAYGNQTTSPLREDMRPLPISPYGLQKYIGEELCRLFSMVYGLSTVSLRYFNVYGARLNPKGPYALVIGKFLDQHKKGESLTVVPPGTQSRDFIHVDDVVRANLLAMESKAIGMGEVINIGMGKDRTVVEIAELIGGPTVMIEPRLEPARTLADISRAKELLGWEPQISLEEGIAKLKKEAGL